VKKLAVYPNKATRTPELLASCPVCKTFETLWFEGNILSPTKRFTQVDGRIYHDCNAAYPCNLFPRFIGEFGVTRPHKRLTFMGVR